ncbi:hypothetical protein QAD02_009997 [Eretmocerus hayati]|uniref:Uncharacterized protein n=1 Tax=Eretmocerus hayati TaxID=131215 RepID=A0ACC2NAV1_9HYME|nr:hypothetical protein QAD02_009997 [Eretmocerus hayati]
MNGDRSQGILPRIIQERQRSDMPQHQIPSLFDRNYYPHHNMQGQHPNFVNPHFSYPPPFPIQRHNFNYFCSNGWYPPSPPVPYPQFSPPYAYHPPAPRNGMPPDQSRAIQNPFRPQQNPVISGLIAPPTSSYSAKTKLKSKPKSSQSAGSTNASGSQNLPITKTNHKCQPKSTPESGSRKGANPQQKNSKLTTLSNSSGQIPKDYDSDNSSPIVSSMESSPGSSLRVPSPESSLRVSSPEESSPTSEEFIIDVNASYIGRTLSSVTQETKETIKERVEARRAIGPRLSTTVLTKDSSDSETESIGISLGPEDSPGPPTDSEYVHFSPSDGSVEAQESILSLSPPAFSPEPSSDEASETNNDIQRSTQPQIDKVDKNQSSSVDPPKVRGVNSPTSSTSSSNQTLYLNEDMEADSSGDEETHARSTHGNDISKPNTHTTEELAESRPNISKKRRHKDLRSPSHKSKRRKTLLPTSIEISEDLENITLPLPPEKNFVENHLCLSNQVDLTESSSENMEQVAHSPNLPTSMKISEELENILLPLPPKKNFDENHPSLSNQVDLTESSSENIEQVAHSSNSLLTTCIKSESMDIPADNPLPDLSHQEIVQFQDQSRFTSSLAISSLQKKPNDCDQLNKSTLSNDSHSSELVRIKSENDSETASSSSEISKIKEEPESNFILSKTSRLYEITDSRGRFGEVSATANISESPDSPEETLLLVRNETIIDSCGVVQRMKDSSSVEDYLRLLVKYRCIELPRVANLKMDRSAEIAQRRKSAMLESGNKIIRNEKRCRSH